jgi:hypothetical protein
MTHDDTADAEDEGILTRRRFLYFVASAITLLFATLFGDEVDLDDGESAGYGESGYGAGAYGE